MAALHEHLETAETHLAGSDRERCLQSLLAAWQLGRCEAIATAIVELGADIDRALPPLSAPTKQRLHEQWMELCDAGRAADIGRLLACFLEGNSITIAARAAELGRRPPDPRVASLLAQVVLEARAIGSSGGARKGWRAVFAVLRGIRDPACRPKLEAALVLPHDASGITGSPTFVEYFRDSVRKVLEVLGPEAEIDDAARARLRSIRERVAALHELPPRPLDEPAASSPASAATEAELVDLVARAPDDDVPRHVLADFWLQRGDPRGELMALQLRIHAGGRVSGADKKRERELVRKLARNVVGPLANVLDMKTVVVQRGMLSTCTTAFRRANQRKELVHHPLWSTVTDLSTDEPRLLTEGAARNVRVLRCDAEPLRAVASAAHPLPIRELILTSTTEDLAAVPLLANGELLPSLERLSLRCYPRPHSAAPPNPADFMPLLHGKLLARLSKLTITTNYEIDVGAWIDVIRTLPALPREGIDLGRFDTMFYGIRHGEGGIVFGVRVGRYADQAVRRMLARLEPTFIERFEVHEDDDANLVEWLAGRFPSGVVRRKT